MMEYVHIPHVDKKVCRVGLGTWAIGGWLWGGTDEQESIRTIHRAFDLGFNLIDTAPVYGFGLSEEIVGKALKTYPKRHDICVATKVGLNWVNGNIFRDARKQRIAEEIEASLKRLKIERIDVYQVHWPDLHTPFEETATALLQLLEEGKIGAIGVSNFTNKMMETFRLHAPLHTLQSPYNLFEREIEKNEIPYCHKNGMVILGYGALCRGLLSAKMQADRQFTGDDLRKIDPKFNPPHCSQYIQCTEKLNAWAQQKYGKSLLEFALRWILDQGVEISLWGARHPEQLDPFEQIWDWTLTESDKKEVEAIISATVTDPVGPEFMAPPTEKLAKKT